LVECGSVIGGVDRVISVALVVGRLVLSFPFSKRLVHLFEGQRYMVCVLGVFLVVIKTIG
jgi:hypothetical protein